MSDRLAHHGDAPHYIHSSTNRLSPLLHSNLLVCYFPRKLYVCPVYFYGKLTSTDIDCGRLLIILVSTIQRSVEWLMHDARLDPIPTLKNGAEGIDILVIVQSVTILERKIHYTWMRCSVMISIKIFLTI